MRKGPSGVPVAAQALDEAEPSGDALDNGPYAIRVLVAKLRLCEDVRGKRKQNKKPASTNLLRHRGLLPNLANP